MSTITINVDDKLFKECERFSAMRGVSVTDYTRNALLEVLESEEVMLEINLERESCDKPDKL